ncbi:uncharacterized protein LOC143376942 [Andrena cerasifolii]|uniref:uncharacterized protein LOC143376942 n=1 Tax=Andrena cerasifolii TaxID=2819439 RepID=UPI0040384C44
MDTSDSSMDTTNGGPAAGVAGVGTIASVVAGAASLSLVKAETPELLAGTSTTPSSVIGPVTAATGLFAGIVSANKTSRPDDWLAASSPGSPSTLQNQHVVYTTPQQQLSESQQQQPPLAHSSPLAHQQQQPASNNGYASPMSTSSYDPYSPNSKIGELHRRHTSTGTSYIVVRANGISQHIFHFFFIPKKLSKIIINAAR